MAEAVMNRYGYAAGFLRMLIDAMTSVGSYEEPAICFDEFEYVPILHRSSSGVSRRIAW
jgi:hypothetical protein